MQACEDSLRRLQTDTIDLYYIHRFDPHTHQEETLAALDDLVRSGKVAVLKENDGQLAMLGQLGSGDVFGQLALLRDQPRAATIKALSRLEVFTLAKEEFDAAIRTSNSFREQLEKLSFY